jgi:transposase
MMGQLPAAQNALFYDFCLERHIPSNHLLRHIDQFLDFDSIRLHLEPFYSSTGRPSIDPELMIRMLLVGYCYGIRSERRLCDEVNFNLAYRWFCRIGLEDDVPDHSTFSKNRHGRYRDSDLFRYVFDTVVQKCMEEGLVKGEGFAIDASFIRADVSRQRAVRSDEPMDWGPSSTQTRAVREYFEALDENPALRRTQKSISLTDPMAQWTAAKGPAVFSYSTNYIVDVEHGVIMDVEASPSTTQTEVQTTRTMIDRIESRHHVKPCRLMGDTAYGAAANLGYLVDEKDIEPHMPVPDKSDRKDNTLSRSDFVWIEEKDEYRCPNGKPLRSSGRVDKDSTIRYRASKMDCEVCPLKRRCCPNTPSRKIPRSIFEHARDKARDIYKSVRYKKSFDERKMVEMVFGHMKRNLNFQRLRLRGIKSANDEFLLVATAQNLRKMARLRGQPPPAAG